MSSGGLLKRVIGQDKASQLLGRSYSRGRLSHAYLFTGPVGVGRFTAALELAAAWMCGVQKDGYCGLCRDCTRIFNFQHPDVMITLPVMGSTTPEDIAELLKSRAQDGVTPLRFQGNTRIGIDQIRELEERLWRKAYENKGHIEIILDADRMGTEASNALLKTLEEPPGDTVLILVSSRWSGLLPTIRSRTHLIRFRRLSQDIVAGILMERLGLDGTAAMELARRADGRPGVALSDAAEGRESDDAAEAAGILRSLWECESVSGALSLATGTAGKLRREGSLEFSRRMQVLLHDLRRRGMGLEPIGSSVQGSDAPELDDGVLDSCIRLFEKAESRLLGNGMTSAVLAAAFTGSWGAMHGED